MKKIILAISIAVVLTGCGNKLKCTKTIKNDVMSQKITYKVHKNKNEIKEVETIEKYEIYNEDINENYDYLLSFRFEDLNNNNIKYDYSHKGNKYNLTTTYDFSTMSEETITSYIGTKDADEYTNKLINEGFICK